MKDPDSPQATDLPTLLADGEHEAALASLERLEVADSEVRKRTLRSLRDFAGERPVVFDGVTPALVSFLGDEVRAVRLTTAKLMVELARADPDLVLPVVEALADRLADGAEFYYVRARSAEALGYVAREYPEDVVDRSVLADLTVGLALDDTEVKQKLAKAVENVALGDPDRLSHRVSSLADHLDDDAELVRYHLCSALAAVGCEHPAALADAMDALGRRLDDESPHVRGRAAEALGLCARSSTVDVAADLDLDAEDVPEFEARRVRFARRQRRDDDATEAVPDGVGTLQSIRDGTDDAVEEITSPDHDGECPHCGLELPEGGPPTCPGCGAPY